MRGCRKNSNPSSDEFTGLITIENQLLKNFDELPQSIDDVASSQDFRLCLPLAVFNSAFKNNQ